MISGRDGTVLRDIFGEDRTELLGIAVAGGADVDGDGYDDILVGSRNPEITGPLNMDRAGKAQLFSGKDGSLIYSYLGWSPGAGLGASLDFAGDVDRDGYQDFIVGAPQADRDDLTVNPGAALVISGLDGSEIYRLWGDDSEDDFGRSVAGLGDLNGDGYADFAVGSGRGGADNRGYVRVFMSNGPPLVVAGPAAALLLSSGLAVLGVLGLRR